MKYTDTIRIVCDKGFNYEVNVEHHPTSGISIAYYNGTRISSVEYGRWIMPWSDDDKEWEEFEERFRENCVGYALMFFEQDCKTYFNNK